MTSAYKEMVARLKSDEWRPPRPERSSNAVRGVESIDMALSEIATAAPGFTLSTTGRRFGVSPASHSSAVMMVAFDQAPGNDAQWTVLSPGSSLARPDGQPFRRVFVRRLSTTPSTTNRVRFDVDPEYGGQAITYAPRSPALATTGALEALLKGYNNTGNESYAEGADGSSATDRMALAIAGHTGAAYVRLLASALGRLAVNLIASQDGIAAGAGAVGATVPRVTLASDDPLVAIVTAARAAVNPIVGQAGVGAGVGDTGATVVRTVPVTIPTAVATQVVVPVGSTAIVAANANRRSVLIKNRDATNGVVLNAGAAAVVATHFLLPAGASIKIESRQAINGIRANAADVTVDVWEESY